MSQPTRRDDDAALPRLYLPEEIAKALGCSEWWVKEQARRRRIPFTRAGGAYRFTAEHFEEIVDFFEERPTAQHPRTAKQSTHFPPRPRHVRSGGTDPTPAVRLRARPPRRTARQ